MIKRFLNILLLSLFAVVLPATMAARAADENVIIVLDASGSMWGQIEGKAKIQIAREVMDQVLGDLDGKAEIGIMTYGHRRKGDCGDIENLVPVGKVNRSAYMAKINKLSPKGKTPISASVRMAAEALKFTENKATVILVSDGLETCNADPCALAKELEQAGIDFTAHVVGFDLQDQDTASLQCLASETGGKYLSADNADELGDAIGTVVAAAPEPTPEPKPATGPANLKVNVRLAAGSDPIDTAYIYAHKIDADGAKGEAIVQGASRKKFDIPPGKVLFSSKVGAATVSDTVDVSADTRDVDLILDAGLLKVSATEAEGGAPNKQAYIYVYEAEPDAKGNRKQVTTGNQRIIFTLPAGNYHVEAKLGKATIGGSVEIKPGERTDLNLVMASGYLQVQGTETEGGEPNKDAYIYVYEAEADLNGKRKQVTSGNQRNVFSLPAGRYFVTAELGKAKTGQEIEVKAGKRTDIMLVLGSGIMKVTAIPTAGAKPLEGAYITIYEAEKALDGGRTRVESGNQRNQFKLPGGKYLVEAKIDMAIATMEVELAAGKRAEPVIDLNAGALLVKGSKDFYVRVFEFEKDLEGNRSQLDAFRPSEKPKIIPAGKYFISGKNGAKVVEAEVEVKAGKLAEVTLKP